jgi:hypothetical protein
MRSRKMPSTVGKEGLASMKEGEGDLYDGLVLPCVVLFGPALPCLVLSCIVLYCLFYSILFYSILFCSVLFYSCLV